MGGVFGVVGKGEFVVVGVGEKEEIFDDLVEVGDIDE